jgi:hypothetical protein
MSRALRVAVLAVIAIGCAVALLQYGRIPQPAAYHAFADTRMLLRIPNGLNVLSNVPFFFVGLAGLRLIGRGPSRDPDGPFRPGAHTAFETLRERPAYVLFFVGIFLTTFGSGYYHWRPDTLRLFWDRLPMAMAFSALFAVVIAERISVYASRMLLLPLVFAGIASVVLWRVSEQAGRGDLRPYLFVQLFPMLALPLMILMFRSRYSRGLELLGVIGVYAVAKVAEIFDQDVFVLTMGTISGHTIKHLLAAVSAWLVVDMLKKRGLAPAG